MQLKIKKIRPVYTQILTTANRYESDVKEGNITVITKGTLMEYQTVISVGNMVKNVSVGEMIKINPQRYIVKKYDTNSVKEDLGKNPIVGFKFPILNLDGVDYMLLQDNDIDYIVEDFEQIPDEESKIIIPKKEFIV